MNTVLLNNVGYVIEKLPEKLFRRLKHECSVAEQEKFNPTGLIPEMVSGLSGNGVAKHYFVQDAADELNSYALKFFAETYNKQFNLLDEFKMLTNSVPVVAHTPWINIQEKYEFVPNHQHDGIASYVIWIKIPYDPKSEQFHGGTASCFQFTYTSITGSIRTQNINVDKQYEGCIMMFPAKLQHCVYPFYTSNDVRISISGNISFDTRGQ